MSFYRTLLAAVAAVVIAGPVFAADDAAGAAQQNPSAAATATAPTTASADQQANTADAKLNLNSATVKQLMKVKGISATKAKAIIAYRKKHGEFKSLDQLASVKGFKKIAAEKMKAIEDQLSVE